MHSIPLRRLVSAIGLLVAVTTATSIPLGYAIVSYLAEADRLSFEASFNASRVARYAYQYGDMWPFHRVRLAELIERSGDGRDAVMRIFTAKGKLVLEEGSGLATPVLTRSAPVQVSGAIVGRLEVDMSARPLLLRTLAVAALSLALGFLAYFGIRVFPLRVLDRTMTQLNARENELTNTNSQFDSALSNLHHGLIMFDAERRLVLCNDRYASMYGLPAALTRSGTRLDDIMAYRSSIGSAPEDAKAYVAQAIEAADRAGTGVFNVSLTDGRTVKVSHTRMANGGFVSSHEDITDAVQAEAEIAYMAHHDGLTDLPNRARFREEMHRAMAGVRRGDTLAVLYLDLDEFKSVNDTLGHPVGDALLRSVAERLRGCVRDTDRIARLGGDEFAVLQVGADDPRHTTGLAERLIETLSVPYDVDGHQVVIGTSVGIALSPSDGQDPDQLLKAADLALYRAKKDGRGVFRFFEHDMDAKMQERRALELDLRSALLNSEFEVHYQPLMNLSRNEVSGFEALLRWNHPKRGQVPPADFIPLTEEIGIINQLGAWVLKQACADAVAWPDHVRVAVNLSPVQFRSRALVLDVISALSAAGLPARRLELEITETVMLQDTEATLATLYQLKDLGVSISMDDFGTGYSSLSYLRRFPFDHIKIDQSFIRDLPNGTNASAIVRAVSGLGASLGMSTTAEGVETTGQLRQLRAEGCTEAQGWLFSPARPAAEVPGLLASLAEQCRAVA
jgi:diguanylate cyclase (GGDEF)-like protein